MKFVISTERVKRELLGPFDMIASRKDFEHLRDTLTENLNDESWCYATVEVEEPVDRRKHPCNTKVLTWEEEGKIVPV